MPKKKKLVTVKVPCPRCRGKGYLGLNFPCATCDRTGKISVQVPRAV